MLSSICAKVGFTTNSPSTYAIRVAPMGPSKGMSEIESAADAPMTASTSRVFSRSTERGVMITCTSFLKPLGNSGRTGRSVSRSTRMASVLGRPSRRKKLPGILPLA